MDRRTTRNDSGAAPNASWASACRRFSSSPALNARPSISQISVDTLLTREHIYTMKAAPHHQLTTEEKDRIEAMAKKRTKREDRGDAFMRENPNGPNRVNDDLAEDMAENFLLS